jgi:pimeloyl-ACP methyl ester carboxylesterase
MTTSHLAGAVVAAAMLAAMAMTAPVLAAPAPTDLSKSLVPGYPDVVGEYMQIPGFKAPGTPDALNTAAFLRLRAVADGEDPKPANAVIIAMPGFSSTPPHWLWLSTQLVHKASERTCDDGKPCRVEVWIIKRRGANLADTAGLREARAKSDPKIALDYYFGTGAIAPDPDRGGARSVNATPGAGDAKWRALTQSDLAFMADWGFETYAGDADRMIALVKSASGARNVFIAGHSQGGAFVSNYAGRLQGDGKRGVDKLAGLIYLDAITTPGAPRPLPDASIKDYFDHVDGLRSGKLKVYTDSSGALGAIAGPQGAVTGEVVFTYFALRNLDDESVFPLIAKPTAPSAGDAFKHDIRVSELAAAGMSLDVDPLPGADLQVPILRFLGEGLGRLDFRPVKGTESLCDLAAPAAAFLPGLGPPPARGPGSSGASPRPPSGPMVPFNCIPSPAMLDAAKVYGWLEAGGDGAIPGKVGKARLWARSEGFAPSRSNIRPLTMKFAQSGTRTIDASSLIGSNFYPSERHDYDAGFWSRSQTIKVAADGVSMDIDKSVITIPVYVARRSSTPHADNPFPGVTDFTEINRTGTYQSDAARALSPIDPRVNVALYNHTDIVSADDSLAGKVRPGEPGASAISDTLIDWVLRRSKGRAAVPTPMSLGVRDTY